MKTFSSKIKLAAATAIVTVGNAINAYAQEFNADTKIDAVTARVRSIATSVCNLVSVAIGVAGLGLLTWNYIKYNKGDSQNADSLMHVGGGLVIVAILIEAINIFFIRG